MSYDKFLEQKKQTAGFKWPDRRSFFGNEFLRMIYDCPNVPGYLHDLRTWLHSVTDHRLAKITRARNARCIAQWFTRSSNRAEAQQWWDLACLAGDPIAVYSETKQLLDDAGYTIIRGPRGYLPSIHVRPGIGAVFRDLMKPAEELMMHLINLPRVRERGLEGWLLEEIKAEIDCIVLFFILAIKVFDQDQNDFESRFIFPAQENKEENESLWPARARSVYSQLAWLEPIWSWLINQAAAVCMNEYVDPERAEHLSEQLERERSVVKTFLFHLSEAAEQQHFSVAQRFALAENPAEEHGQNMLRQHSTDKVILVRGEIPETQEKNDAAFLKKFEKLRSPMPVARLPSAEKIGQIEAELKTEFPWATCAIETVIEELLARASLGSRKLNFSPLVLVGPPGSGKTRFAQRLGEKLLVENTKINCAGMPDNKIFRGLTRGWSGARPSLIVEKVCAAGSASCLFVLDEIDKLGAGGGNSGDPRAVLLDLLEPTNSRSFLDSFLMTEVDLSYCLYVATANSLELIPAPLLDRLNPVLFPAPGPEHKAALINSILADLAHEWGLPDGTIELKDENRKLLAGLSSRQLKRTAIRLLARQAKERPGALLMQ
ncbi:AAA family ATPase [Neopusillimonas maritima]|uniref:AAA+ ATPase domain-containing protein n=1 Tax=Neopusillimonas maritima TaxID=2026239 RepID=A0ABX9MZ97_9BURK|nr:AAA family ATPase [Neopusillimonas maritima]RII83856.1 hypothetical protein CJO09_01025 [Neopusillimonas maritima]